MTTQTHNSELVNYTINHLDNGYTGTYGADLHNELFNTEYYIIGRYQAEQWLINNVGIFAAIDEIKEYENDNFGTVTTDFSEPEKVVNMYVYIKGQEILAECPTLDKKWNDKLTDKDIVKIKKELKKLL
jgi:hypothetical protein